MMAHIALSVYLGSRIGLWETLWAHGMFGFRSDRTPDTLNTTVLELARTLLENTGIR